jgi:TusA-related sulfurtransferase
MNMASSLHKIIEEMDLTSFDCPEPFMMVVTKLMKIENGELKIRYKDPKCREMFLDSLKLMNCRVLEDSEQDGIFIIHIKKESSSSEKPKGIKLTGGC